MRPVSSLTPRPTPDPSCRATSKAEFDAFLECGILAHGFLRLRCGARGHDKLLAFSCKRRGFCPSCGARRMSQAAAHLVDHVIPHLPVRQWVLSLPIPLRALLAAQAELVTPVLQVVQRVVTRHLLRQRVRPGHAADAGHARTGSIRMRVAPRRHSNGARPQGKLRALVSASTAVATLALRRCRAL
jgi:hypothetical protein